MGAMALGTDMLELDVHWTAEGRLVAMHDSRVDRTTEGSGVVYEMILAEVPRGWSRSRFRSPSADSR